MSMLSPPMREPELLPIAEVAARLHVSPSTVRRMIEDDLSFPRPVMVRPNKLRIRAAELAAYICLSAKPWPKWKPRVPSVRKKPKRRFVIWA